MNDQLTANSGNEARLLAACARTVASDATALEIGRALESGIDWTVLARLALANRATPLLHRTLSGLDHPGVPAEFRQALADHDQANRERCEALVDETLSLLRTLEQRRIQAVPFKGVSLARQVYGEVALRWAGDIDLFVRREDLYVVGRVLVERGYVESSEAVTRRRLSPTERAWYVEHQCEYLFERHEDGMLVEPHWAAARPRLAILLDYEAMLGRVTPFDLGEHAVPSFEIEDLLLLLAVHGAKHEWAELRWCCDVAELIRSHAEIDWDRAVDRARRYGCRRILTLALLLARDLLDAPLCPELAPLLDHDREAASLVQEVAGRIFDPDASRLPPSGTTRFHLRMRERLRDRLACRLRSATTPSFDQVRLLPLPGPLAFLHRPIRWIADHVAAPARRLVKSRLDRSDRAPTSRIDVEACSRRSVARARWAEQRSEMSSWLHERLLQVVDVAHGQTVLASGGGDQVLRVARSVKRHASVTAVDASPEVLSRAGRRARDEALDNLCTCSAVLEELPFASDSFDAVLCRFDLEDSQSPERVLAEALRVLRSSRRAAFMVWGPREGNTGFAVTERAVRDFFHDDSAVPLAGRFSFAEPDRLAGVLRHVGYRDVEELEIRRSVPIPDDPCFWHADFELTYGELTERLPRSVQQALREAVAGEFEELRGRGTLLESHARIAVGAKA